MKSHLKKSLSLLLLFIFVATLGAQEIRKYDVLIIKKNQSRLVGKVTTEGNKVIFESKDGTIQRTFDRDEVEIIPRNTPKSVYEKKAKSTPLDKSDQRMELAKFCLKYDLNKEAKEELNRALASDPSLKEAYKVLSDLYYRERLQFLQKPPAEQDQKEYRQLLNRELSVYLQAEKNGIGDSQLSFRASQIYLQLNLPESAAQHLEMALKLAGENPSPEFKSQVPLLQAKIQLKLKNWQKAFEFYQEIGEGKNLPLNLQYQYLMGKGQCLFRLGKIEEAIAPFQKVLDLVKAKEMDPLKMEPTIMLATLYFLKGGTNLQKSEKLFRQVLDLMGTGQLPRRVTVLANLSLVNSHQGKFQSGKKFLDEARELREKLKKENVLAKSPMIYLAEGYLHQTKGEVKKAAKLYERAARLATRDGFLHYLAGHNYFKVGLYKEARQSFQKAIKYKFNPADSLLSLAFTNYRDGNLEAASRYLEYIGANIETTQFQSKYSAADVFYFLGLIRLKRKNFDSALQAFKEAVKKDSRHILALNGMGYIYYRKAQKSPPEERKKFLDLAHQILRQALSYDPQNSYANQILSQISSVRKLKMWKDEFNRPDSPRPYNQWKTAAKAGIDVKVAGKKLVFEGTQAIGDERTLASRILEEGKSFVKYEATINVASAVKGKREKSNLEVGVSVEGNRSGKPAGKIRVFATPQGLFYHHEQFGNRQSMSSPKRLGPVPENGEIFVSITLDDRRKGIFLVQVNDHPLMQAKIPYLGRANYFQLNIFGKAAEKVSWKLEVEKVRIFKKR